MAPPMSIDNHKSGAGAGAGSDCTLNLPEECLSFIFQSPLLLKDDLDNCSLVCRRWLRIEGQSRRRLSLSQQSDIAPSIPSIFARFDSITDLSLKGGCLLGDETLISLGECKNLTSLTLHGCEVTVAGVEAMLDTCVGLEILSLRSTLVFDAGSGRSSAWSNSDLEELRFAESLKVISLEEIDTFDDKFLCQLIKSSKSLTTFKLISIGTYPSLSLDLLAASTTEIHLEHVVVHDSELYDISSCCPNLEILRLVKFFGSCSNDGIVMVAKRCKSLRVLHVDDCWYRRSRGAAVEDEDIWDQGLMAVAKNCPNLQELLLDGVRVTQLSLEMLGAECVKLERLSLCAVRDVSDAELMCITTNWNALNKLWIEYCPVSDRGVQALAYGCPNLAQVMFRECEALTLEGIDGLRASRGSLLVDFDKDGRGRAEWPAKRIKNRFSRLKRLNQLKRVNQLLNRF